MLSGSFETSRLFQTIRNGGAMLKKLIMVLPISIAATLICWLIMKLIEKKCVTENKLKVLIIERKRWILGFVFYISILVQVGVLSRTLGTMRTIVWIPFRTPGGDNLIVLYALANLVLFIPFGVLVPKVFHSVNAFWKIILVALLTSVCIEIIQYILACGYSQVEDVIMNVAGGVIGYLIIKFIEKRKNEKRKNEKRECLEN